jgi:hypothetical protein
MCFIALITTIGCLLFVRRRSQKFNKWFIFGLLLSAFLLHFGKQLFEPYRSDFPGALRHSTFENICAVSTLLFPWFYLSKSNLCRDYMYFVGMLSGLAAMVVPTEALGKDLLTFNVLRFYYGHIIIFLAPLLMVVTKQHTLNYHRILKVPFMFILILGIILVNEVILIGTGFVESDMADLFDPNTRNASFIFGPTDQFQNAIGILTIFVPKLMLTVPIGPNAGKELYWPVVWLVIPVCVYIWIISFLLSLPFDGKHIMEDIRRLFSRIVKRNEIKYE